MPLEYTCRPICIPCGRFFAFGQIFTPRIKPPNQTNQIRYKHRHKIIFHTRRCRTYLTSAYTANSTVVHGHRYFFWQCMQSLILANSSIIDGKPALKHWFQVEVKATPTRNALRRVNASPLVVNWERTCFMKSSSRPHFLVWFCYERSAKRGAKFFLK